MPLYLYISKGPQKGKSFKVHDGMTIGRAAGDVTLLDSKASSKHAHIVKDPLGYYMIIDNKSRNGVKVKGKQVPKIILKPGMVLQLGNSFLEVKEQASTEEELPPVPDQPKGKLSAAVNWDSFLEEFTASKMKHFKDQPKAIAPFAQAVHLHIYRGLQVDTEWTLGYGPRKAGAKSLDLPILEPGAPDECFLLIPRDQGIEFETKHPNLVKLNGKSISTELLTDGDDISINGTCIKVNYIE